MPYSNERTILKEIQTKLNADFMAKAKEIAARSGDEITFNVKAFSDASLNDLLIEHEEFGLIYVQNGSYESQPSLGNSVVNTILINIQVIAIDKGDLPKDVSIIRMTLAELLLSEDYDFENSSNIKIDGTEPTPLDFGAKGSTIKYVASGVIARFQLGF